MMAEAGKQFRITRAEGIKMTAVLQQNLDATPDAEVPDWVCRVGPGKQC